MTPYLETVRAYSVAINTKQHEEKVEKNAADALAWQERLTPLETRVSNLLTTIPTEIQNQGLALTSLRSMLAGKWRGKCHPGELGQALRKLGFERRRNWTKATTSFNALWFPVSAEK